MIITSHDLTANKSDLFRRRSVCPEDQIIIDYLDKLLILHCKYLTFKFSKNPLSPLGIFSIAQTCIFVNSKFAIFKNSFSENSNLQNLKFIRLISSIFDYTSGHKRRSGCRRCLSRSTSGSVYRVSRTFPAQCRAIQNRRFH